jgi:hypothetical protein
MLFSIIVICALFSMSSCAAELDVFPSASELVSINLPPVDIAKINRKFEVEVLSKFSFDRTWNYIVFGRVRGKMLAVRESECGNKLGNQMEFISIAYVQRKFDDELQGFVARSNAVVRARESLMYRSLPSDKEYAELEEIPVNSLSKIFVTEWLMQSYDASKGVEKLARLFLRSKCV